MSKNRHHSILVFLLMFVAILCGHDKMMVAAPLPSEEADAAFERADKQLNAIYQQMRREITRDEARENFVAAERTWIAFRDAQAELAASLSNRGGIAYAYVVTETKTKLTRQRIGQLQELKKQANPEYADFTP